MLKFLKTLGVSALGGAVSAGAQYSGTNDPALIGKASLGGAVIAAIAYLLKSPLTNVDNPK